PAPLAAAGLPPRPGRATPPGRAPPVLDRRGASPRQLVAAGVGGVAEDPRCTIEDKTLFSHRRGAPTGRIAGVIWIDQGAGG
ncbi:laccase domain-containing protein, partial [Nocardia farcinica]|uniref:laccase domain-containing protein n=1 Tax=Nocardia farcinica TaxID=37329 RepID=UPI002454ECC4